ncbi:MAG TPA: GerMN domain-containing protein [Fimbriimonadaceae bacterium]|nr:GerMN domain-containing protein [Fimbriimonadaceae bacterium]HRJ33423.1 GerMN domain-containing protein [Fimbriimonadaceae bacterium]
MLLCGAMVVGVLGYYVKFSPANRVPEDQKRASRTSPPVPRDDPTQAKTVQSMRPEYQGDRLQFQSKTKPVPPGTNAIVFAVNEFLGSSQVAPADAKLVTAQVKDKTVTLDFNAAFDTTYGTEDEHTILDGILLAVGQFPSIDFVVFQVEGRPLETLGNIDLTTPQKVIRKPHSHSSAPDLP